MRIFVGIILYSAVSVAVPLQEELEIQRLSEEKSTSMISRKDSTKQSKRQSRGTGSHLPFDEVNAQNFDADIFGLQVATAALMTAILGLLVGHLYENPVVRLLRKLALLPRRNGQQQNPVATAAQMVANGTQSAAQAVSSVLGNTQQGTTGLSPLLAPLRNSSLVGFLTSIANRLENESQHDSTHGPYHSGGLFTNMSPADKQALQEIVENAVKNVRQRNLELETSEERKRRNKQK